MSSTISITYKLHGDAKTLKELANDAEGLKKAFAGAAAEAEQLPKGLGSVKSSAGGLMKSLGGIAAGVVSVRTLAKVMGNAVNTIKDFERANSELASVLGKSTSEISHLSDAAVDLGRKTEFTASEVTALQTSLARLGFSDTQILDMQESVLKLAAAVGTDLASAADFSGAALRAFGMKASDAPKLLDIMAASTSKSALSFSKLQTSIAVVGPVANAFGLDARDTVSILGVLSNAGFDASSAATALRSILLNLADANGKLAKGLGYTANTMPEIINALKDLRDRGVNLNETLAMTDKRSVAAFNALIAGASDVEDLYVNLGDANGALDQMYTTMTDNLEGATKSLSSAWEGLVLSFKESAGPMKNVIQWLTDMVNKITDIRNADKNQAAARQADVSDQARSYYDRLVREYGDDAEAIQKRIAEDIEMADRNWHNAISKAGESRTKRMKKAVKEEYQRQVSVWYDAKQMMQQVQQLANGALTESPVQPTTTEPGGGGGGGGGGNKSKKKTLADAINEYKQSVERAVEVNKLFASSTTDMDARLKAMESGITSIVNKYGIESDAVQELIREYNELLKVRRDSTKSFTAITPSVANLSGSAQIMGKKTAKPGLVGPGLGAFNKQMKQSVSLTETLQTTMGALSGTFRDLAGAVGESAAAWLEWGSNLLSAIAQALPQLAALFVKQNAVATSNTAAAASGAASSVASIPYVGPVLAIAAIASVLAALASLPKFAMGGVVSGPTFGLMGEYPGAANNPEVIAPLNTLRQYMQVDETGGHVDFRIRGRDLYGIYRKDRRRSRRS